MHFSGVLYVLVMLSTLGKGGLGRLTRIGFGW